MSKIKKSEIMELDGPTAFLETLTWPQGVDDCTKENGFTIHCENEPTVLDPLARTYWSLEMAMVWIAFRDDQQVGQVWPEYRHDCCLELQGFFDDGGQVRGELQTPSVSSVWAELWFTRGGEVPLEAASEVLRLKLESGAISATGVIQCGERKSISKLEWCDLYFYFRHHDKKGDCIVYTDAKKWTPDTLPEYTRVRVPVKEMLREFPAHEADEVRSEFERAAIEATWPCGTGGRKLAARPGRYKTEKRDGAEAIIKILIPDEVPPTVSNAEIVRIVTSSCEYKTLSAKPQSDTILRAAGRKS